jgi:hypothetical protein
LHLLLAWAIEFAEVHPEASILGTDLSPIQPSKVPPNCSFIIDDATKEWVFTQQFDFIHTRAIAFGISDWDKLVDQAYNALKPGGWLELQEFHLPLGCDDGSMAEGTMLWKWGKDINLAAGKVGIDSLASLQHSERIRKRGFDNVNEAQLKIPLGVWAKGNKEKKIGSMARKDLVDGIEGISTKLFLMLGYGHDEVKEMLEEVRGDLMNSKVSLGLVTWQTTAYVQSRYTHICLCEFSNFKHLVQVSNYIQRCVMGTEAFLNGEL